jgi:hypothetical protein
VRRSTQWGVRQKEIPSQVPLLRQGIWWLTKRRNMGKPTCSKCQKQMSSTTGGVGKKRTKKWVCRNPGCPKNGKVQETEPGWAMLVPFLIHRFRIRITFFILPKPLQYHHVYR